MAIAGPADADPGDVTLQSYDAAADRYVEHRGEPSAALLAFLDEFSERVGDGVVLELGTGPGRDADYLEKRGLRVVRTDATPAFVEMLRATGCCALLVDVRTDDLGGPYAGILANAVLHHLDRAQFADVLVRARRALEEGGVLAFTIKEGDGAAWSNAKLDLPRHFTYWREPEVRVVLARTGWQLISLDHVAGRADAWLYVLATPRQTGSERSATSSGSGRRRGRSCSSPSRRGDTAP